MSIKQNTGESTDAYLARAEKMALGHDLTKVYKVQFIVNGLNNFIKSRIIGKKLTKISGTSGSGCFG